MIALLMFWEFYSLEKKKKKRLYWEDSKNSKMEINDN